MSQPRQLGRVEVTGFIFLVVVSLLTSLVYIAIFARVRLLNRRIISPGDADSAVATAPTFGVWFQRARALTADDARQHGGIDLYVFLERARFQRECASVIALACVPLALAFAFGGSQSSAGFSRMAYTNILRAERRTQFAWSWAVVLAVYITHVYFLRALDAVDKRAHAAIYAALREEPRSHHYALIVSELEGLTEADRKASARLAVTKVLGRPEAALLVSVLPQLSAALPADDDEKPPSDGSAKSDKGSDEEKADAEAGGASGRKLKRKPSMASKMISKLSQLIGGTGLRQRTAEFQTKLAAVAGADKAYRAAERKAQAAEAAAAEAAAAEAPEAVAAEAAEAAATEAPEAAAAEAAETPPRRRCGGKAPVVLEAPDVKMARCRLEANEAREAVIAALEADFPAFSRVGIVIVDSLAGACVATRVDKFGSPHVECAPEPRDVVWAELEKLPNRFERRLKERAGFSTKAWIFLIWGIIVAAITVGILAGLAEASKVGGPVQTVCALLAPIVEAAIVNFLLEYMADVIRDSMAPKFDSAWTRSRAEYVQQRDYTTFLLLVAFFARLLGGSLYTTISEISKPTQVFALLAAAVPASAYIFLNYIFYRICLDVNGATQVARWAVMRVKLKFLPPANQFSLDRAMDAPPPLLAKVASWDTFVLVVLLTFAPLAPVTALMSCAYFWNADFWERHTVSIVTKPQFNAAGRLWPLYASQALTCQHIALTTQFAVLLLSSNFWAAIATLPVVVYTLKTRHHVKERAEHGAHGSELQGRLRVADAYDVDEARGRVALGDLRSASGVDAQLAWAAPCRPRDASQPAELLGETALDASADVDDDDHDVNERLVANHAWTTRCDDAEFTRMAEAPQQSTEAPEQSKGDDILEAKAQEP